jgi:hypothetical protein
VTDEKWETKIFFQATREVLENEEFYFAYNEDRLNVLEKNPWLKN